MDILHISAECYPAAKAGGLGDVAGALPKYLNQIGSSTALIMPRYSTKWLNQQTYQTVYDSQFQMGARSIHFEVQLIENNPTGFPIYVTNIPGVFDRPGVYTDAEGNAFQDEVERAIAFQLAALYWIKQLDTPPRLVHCHDHHTGLVPFLMSYAFDFSSLKNTPTVFTIHNGEYHGSFSWEKKYLLPDFDASKNGLLDWNGKIVPLASAVKCAWKLTTVSPSYMAELRYKSNGLEGLLKEETSKSSGILNGIDTEVWNPKTDSFLIQNLTQNFTTYKNANRKALCKTFGIDENRKVVAFIGRLVREKGAALLPEAISRFIYDNGHLGFVLLGTGDKNLHRIFDSMNHHFPGQFSAKLEYNEGLAHQIYAGADFLLMPSLVEPCGLNQMYAMRYGTIPMVRAVGGLKDTVPDIGLENGSGIRFDYYSVDEIHHALNRADNLSKDDKLLVDIQKRNTKLDFSWEKSAKTYKELYDSLL